MNNYEDLIRTNDPEGQELRQAILQCRIGNLKNLDLILEFVGYDEEAAIQGKYPFTFDGEIKLHGGYGIPIYAVIDWLGASFSEPQQQIED